MTMVNLARRVLRNLLFTSGLAEAFRDTSHSETEIPDTIYD